MKQLHTDQFVAFLQQHAPDALCDDDRLPELPADEPRPTPSALPTRATSDQERRRAADAERCAALRLLVAAGVQLRHTPPWRRVALSDNVLLVDALVSRDAAPLPRSFVAAGGAWAVLSVAAAACALGIAQAHRRLAAAALVGSLAIGSTARALYRWQRPAARLCSAARELCDAAHCFDRAVQHSLRTLLEQRVLADGTLRLGAPGDAAVRRLALRADAQRHTERVARALDDALLLCAHADARALAHWQRELADDAVCAEAAQLAAQLDADDDCVDADDDLYDSATRLLDLHALKRRAALGAARRSRTLLLLMRATECATADAAVTHSVRSLAATYATAAALCAAPPPQLPPSPLPPLDAAPIAPPSHPLERPLLSLATQVRSLAQSPLLMNTDDALHRRTADDVRAEWKAVGERIDALRAEWANADYAQSRLERTQSPPLDPSPSPSPSPTSAAPLAVRAAESSGVYEHDNRLSAHDDNGDCESADVRRARMAARRLERAEATEREAEARREHDRRRRVWAELDRVVEARRLEREQQEQQPPTDCI
eukprot:TRINITY_DN275_c0_g2_i1.p1 TRINITY_DN275_c0_g2~~TRINITY_DN275_c0_g2_i1.p1  ORF type:complete len:547 (+),score=261.77 TRINITY_DN275_c0_g2_i1:73-1713(+)